MELERSTNHYESIVVGIQICEQKVEMEVS
jgi:hypothetical protein